MSSRLNKIIPHAHANYIHICTLQTIILQTTLTYVPCKLYLLFLQTIILQISSYNCVSSFQRWAMKYGLIACVADVDLKSFSSVRAHFEGLSFDEVNWSSLFLITSPCMFLRNFLLTLCAVTSHLDSIGESSSCCGPKLRGGCHHREKP